MSRRMETLHGLDGLRAAPRGAVLTVGNFDGLHRGHRRLLAACADARVASRAAALVAVTFEPHPLTVLKPEIAPPRLTPPDVKDGLLAAAGVTHLVVLAPTPDVLNTTSEEFLAILGHVRPAHLVEGDTFTFGKGRGGDIHRLRAWASGAGVGLTTIDPVEAVLLNLQVVPVSSSLVRWLLAHGRARDAAICLGRAYALRGAVVEGFKRGRTIGVPTANLRVGDGQMVPLDGVYAGRCAVDGATYPAAVHIGPLPTFDDPVARQVEAHLIGYTGDLYGRTIEVEVLDWLRDVRKFAGVEALKAQIARDVGRAQRTARRADPAREIAGTGVR